MIDFDREFEGSFKVSKKKKITTPVKAYSPISYLRDTIDKVLDYRNKNGKEIGFEEILNFDFENNAEFEIKWMNFSYRHNTWINFEESIEMKGLLKVKNFIKNIKKQAELYIGAPKEDIEAINVEMESQKEVIEGYKNVERIIDEQEGPDKQLMYFVKWVGLQYGECSWEKESDLREENDLKEIEKYHKRIKEWEEKKRCTPLPRKFIKFVEGPEVKNKLRDYQIEGVNWITYAFSQNTNVILADEMGLGKTVQTITFIRHLYDNYNIIGPFLVIVPLSTISNWSKEFNKWAPKLNCVVYTGDGESRAIIRKTEMFGNKKGTIKFNVLLTSFELVIKDQDVFNQFHWKYTVVDEAHRLKNNEGQLYEVLMRTTTENKLLITGTPLQNTLKELWSLLHFLHPKKFISFEEFEKTYSVEGTEEINKIHNELKPYLLRRMKKDVEKSLPPKKERILRVELSPIQKQYYRWIITKNSDALKKAVQQQKTSLMNICMELKKLCNHPILINELMNSENEENLIQSCGKMILLDKLLVKLKETGHRVLIFSQMVRMLDVLSNYLHFRGFNYQRLDGAMGREARQRAMDHFNAKDSTDFVFLLSTRAGGLGINLTTADTVIIYDSDWNPQNDLQAQARCHRIGQEKTVNIYRLATEGTIEEKILLSAKKKLVLDHLIIQTMEKKGKKNGNELFDKSELQKILQFGAQDIFNKDNGERKEVNIDEILERADVEEGKEESSGVNDLLGAFNVENFAISGGNNVNEFWNSVITQQDKEEARKLDEQILGVISKPKEEKEKNERKKRKIIEEVDEKIVRGVLRGMKRFGFARIDDIMTIVRSSYKKQNDNLEEIVRNLMERIINACSKLDSKGGNVRELEMYVEGIKFLPFELVTKNEEMKTIGILVKYMKRHNNQLPFEIKKPQWANGFEWKNEYDQQIVLAVQKNGVGVWSELKKDENSGIDKILAAGATITHIQRRAETIIREGKDLIRRKKVHKEKRKEIRNKKKAEEEKKEEEWKKGMNQKVILEKMNDVKEQIKKLKYIKTHPNLEEKMKQDKTEKYIREIGKFIEQSDEDENIKKQMWYFVSTYTNLTPHEVIEIGTEQHYRKRNQTKGDYLDKRGLN
ncbi:chromodomain-helicase-DNA-binding protein, putative [Entamoeba histolytica HM-3:IMSS]|nr:chromodomain-helicase-DNA-binding protein, putative [Entamoeba histolytica HM-3:IMSS]